MSKSWQKVIGSCLLLLAAAVSISIISSRFYTRVDVTEDKIYSLSPGTRSILEKVENPIDAKFYFSASAKNLPVIIKTYAGRVEEVLHEYAALSGGQINVEVFDPKPDTDVEEWARKYGMQGVRLPTGDNLYFGVVFIQGKREIAVPYFDPRREQNMEYDISQALVQVQQKTKPKIGVMSSLPIMGSMMPPGMGGQGGQTWMIIQQLRQTYDVEKVETNTAAIRPELDLLLVVHPKNLSEQAEYAIDQFVVKGGRAIVLVDPFSRSDLRAAGQMARMSGQMPNVRSDLPKLLAHWGVKYDSTTFVGDLDGMVRINAGGSVINYPFFISMREKNLSQDTVATKDLKNVMIVEGGSLKQREGASLKFEPVIETGPDSGLVSATMATFMGPADLAKELKVDSDKHVIAAFVSGAFSSAFAAAPAPANKDAKAQPYVAKGGEDNSVLVIADTDFLYDDNAVQKINLGFQVIAKPMNDNFNLLLNSIDFMMGFKSGSRDLIAIRSRGRIARPFTVVEEIQKNAQLKYQEEERRLSQKLGDVQRRLTELQSQRTDGGVMTLSPEQEAQIAEFREEEVQVRKARRLVRKNLREDIESLGTTIVAANMLVMPLAVGCFGIVAMWRRSRRTRRK